MPRLAATYVYGHITLKTPVLVRSPKLSNVEPGGDNAELYRNRNGYFSINVQAVCDANLKFTNIIARWPGSVHDIRIFNSRRLCGLFEMELTKNNCSEIYISETTDSKKETSSAQKVMQLSVGHSVCAGKGQEMACRFGFLIPPMKATMTFEPLDESTDIQENNDDEAKAEETNDIEANQLFPGGKIVLKNGVTICARRNPKVIRHKPNNESRNKMC
ncbi:hypothetical protein MAR_016479 [Mya arenaria]|uniref:DDE Tnp4 domain-containing protein n=1 Tax=Mya arenaria TaxID=6604 RepID=A0ABY7FJW4_MYAAR|nr:hypothetical protein MAR_016479 [Mya arenaria]